MVLKQPAKGHRLGTDAVLLIAACPPCSGTIADLGAGVGGVGIGVALNNPEAHVILVERDAEIAALAQDNIVQNQLVLRLSLCVTDLFLPANQRECAGLLPNSVDCVLTNPPFETSDRGRGSPNAKRRAAHVMEGGDLEGWVRACAHILRANGTLVMIHKTDALSDIFAALNKRFGAIEVLPIHSYQDQPAIRVIIKATLGSNAPMKLLPALVLYGVDGKATDLFAKIGQGEIVIEW